MISSSETSQYAVSSQTPGRKRVSRDTVIAEAAKAIGTLMVAQMQEISEANRDLKRSKTEVQLKLFTKQMAYQREKDKTHVRTRYSS